MLGHPLGEDVYLIPLASPVTLDALVSNSSHLIYCRGPELLDRRAAGYTTAGGAVRWPLIADFRGILWLSCFRSAAECHGVY